MAGETTSGISRATSERRSDWSARARKIAAVTAALALTAAGCTNKVQGNAEPSASAKPPATSSTGTTAPNPATSKPECTLKNSVRNEASIRYDGNSVQLSHAVIGSAVRVGDDDDKCLERVTIEMGGTKVPKAERPGIHARYVDPPIRQNPSDKIVAIPGRAFLEVTFGASIHDEEGGEGPNVVMGTGLEHIAEVHRTQKNYEGYNTYVIGVDEKRNFVLQETPGPNCPNFCFTIDIEGK